MVVMFTTTYAISAYYHKSCELESPSWRDILDTTIMCQFVSDLRHMVPGEIAPLQNRPRQYRPHIYQNRRHINQNRPNIYK